MENNRIRELRKASGMTQEQLASVLGINRATLSRYESGDIDPPSSQLYRIADALGVQSWELDKKSYDVTKLIMATAKYSALVKSIIDYDDIPPELKKFIVSNTPEDVATYLFNVSRQLYTMEKPSDSHLSNAAVKLLELFDRLNTSGQQKAIERVEELTEIPRYRAETPVPEFAPSTDSPASED